MWRYIRPKTNLIKSNPVTWFGRILLGSSFSVKVRISIFTYVNKRVGMTEKEGLTEEVKYTKDVDITYSRNLQQFLVWQV